ncbi:formate dehydrogenase subunit gamma [Desulfotalea psychrophila]|uniref:Probable formate dehydrogenase, gamma subunit n=1 Tax=Desulfotalea psychrophila (strain LSv54 / DSM 12343) TaxID=177439 RepID=Q6AIW3_DESPS|nr:formate dehydrogenase subunit gamma [Desulfotalea psychrophila]CAG37717.1 probable formate dehydrogenase, gamma subunit [Desulfotalea psychrophila LSv54]
MIKKFLISIITTLSLASAAYAADSQIWGTMIIPNILGYGQEQSLHLGPWFTFLQGVYFSKIFLATIIGVPALFLGHYLIFGPKIFSHAGKKIYIFPAMQRIVHLLAAVAFIILIPSGLMIVFAKYLGGGPLVAGARHLHGIATLIFLLSLIPMFLFWVREMLPTADDIKWVLILGGYLSKEIKEIPAGKFNAGQKMWFWMATVGGLIMIGTGAAMYLQDFNYGIASSLGLSQIDLLRISVLVHNGLALLITAFFFTHAYMSLFAIKGAIHSIINGYKEHDEVMYLHSSYYKQLKQSGKIE